MTESAIETEPGSTNKAVAEEPTTVVYLVEYQYKDAKGSYYPWKVFTDRERAEAFAKTMNEARTHTHHFVTALDMEGSL